MAEMKDLKSFCYPLSPTGKSALLGNFPWHYGTEYLNVAYRTDPAKIEAWLPKPLELSRKNPDMAYVAFSKWWSVWEGCSEMAFINPERTQYKEAAVWGQLLLQRRRRADLPADMGRQRLHHGQGLGDGFL